MMLGDGLVVTDLRHPGFILTRWEEMGTVIKGAVWKKRVDQDGEERLLRCEIHNTSYSVSRLPFHRADGTE